MHIDSLRLERIRIIGSAELEPSPGVNFIVGANASGKTSLLEGIDFLSRGRSFRAARADELVQHGGEYCRAIGGVVSENSGVRSKVGIERARGRTRARIDGADAASLASLARRLAVVVLEPGSVDLVSGGPSERRSVMDWGCFHFSSAFLEAWQGYGRLLAQRNALLKQRVDLRMLEALDRELAVKGESVSAVRWEYLVALANEVHHLAELVLGGRDLTWEYRRGWRVDESLYEALLRKRATDSERGFTSAGPHRADFELMLAGETVSRVASRGQQKACVAVLKLAQARLLAQQTGEKAVMLLDDVASELDRDHRAGVLRGVLELGGQVFATAIEEGAIGWEGVDSAKMFHVEHGRVQELL